MRTGEHGASAPRSPDHRTGGSRVVTLTTVSLDELVFRAFRGPEDYAGMAALIEEMYGVPAADVGPAIQEWVRRMGQSMVIGQQLRTYMGY